jgi:hypothetical protein
MTYGIGDTGRERSEGRTLGPDRNQRKLAPFVGTWRVEGRQYEGVFGHAAQVSAEETFEWLPGGQFMIHRFSGKLGGSEMACVEIIESDPESGGGFPVHTFYNDGHSQEFHLSERGREWILDTTWTSPESSPRRVRCVQRFENDARTRSARWDSSTDGVAWETFWDVTATKKGFDRAEPDVP